MPLGGRNWPRMPCSLPRGSLRITLELLHGKASDANTPGYLKLKEQLSFLTRSGDGYRFAYLMIMREGQIVFLVDSEPVGSKDESVAGDIYYDVSEIRTAFKENRAVTEGPQTDVWGTWMSGFAPVPSAVVDGSSVVLGLDRDATQWAGQLARLRQGVMTATLIFASNIAEKPTVGAMGRSPCSSQQLTSSARAWPFRSRSTHFGRPRKPRILPIEQKARFWPP